MGKRQGLEQPGSRLSRSPARVDDSGAGAVFMENVPAVRALDVIVRSFRQAWLRAEVEVVMERGWRSTHAPSLVPRAPSLSADAGG
jgi:hypothetical protein